MKRTIILTGASDGIGAAAAKRLATDDNTLILVGRNSEKTRAVAAPLGCTYLTADFSDLSQVRDLAARIKEKVPRIDVLINNAGGIFGAVREETVDGYEKTFQVNHLSPFLLTNLLLNELAEGEGVVVNTASLGAKLFSELDMDDLNLQHNYSSTRAYGNSKLANILFAKELSVRFADRGIFGVSYHPVPLAQTSARAPRALRHGSTAADYSSPSCVPPTTEQTAWCTWLTDDWALISFPVATTRMIARPKARRLLPTPMLPVSCGKNPQRW